MEEPADEDFIDAKLNWRVQLKRDNGMLFYTYTDRATGEQIRGAARLSAAHEQLKRLEKYVAQQDRLGVPEKELRDALRIVYPELGANGLALPYGSLPALKLAFFTYFRVPLSEEALATRRRGAAHGNYWTINFLFELDKWGGTFLECYASNLFTNERWIRIDENGTVTTLGTGADWELDDDSPLDLRERVKARGLDGAGAAVVAPENPYYFQYDAPFKVGTQRARTEESESPFAFKYDHFMASSWRLLNFHVAGFHHHAGPALIATMRTGDKLTLVAEPYNTYDPQAVRLDFKGMKIGYVPRAHNTIIAALMAQSAPLECTITAVDPEAEAWNAVEAEIRQLRREGNVSQETAFFTYDSGAIEAPIRQLPREMFVAKEPAFFQYDTGPRKETFVPRETAFFKYDDGTRY